MGVKLLRNFCARGNFLYDCYSGRSFICKIYESVFEERKQTKSDDWCCGSNWLLSCCRYFNGIFIEGNLI